MPVQGAVRTLGQQAEAALQLTEQTRQPQLSDVPGGQFNGQRNAVQSLAYVDGQWQLSVVEFKAVLTGHGPLDKQLQRRKT